MDETATHSAGLRLHRDNQVENFPDRTSPDGKELEVKSVLENEAPPISTAIGIRPVKKKVRKRHSRVSFEFPSAEPDESQTENPDEQSQQIEPQQPQTAKKVKQRRKNVASSGGPDKDQGKERPSIDVASDKENSDVKEQHSRAFEQEMQSVLIEEFSVTESGNFDANGEVTQDEHATLDNEEGTFDDELIHAEETPTDNHNFEPTALKDLSTSIQITKDAAVQEHEVPAPDEEAKSDVEAKSDEEAKKTEQEPRQLEMMEKSEDTSIDISQNGYDERVENDKELQELAPGDLGELTARIHDDSQSAAATPSCDAEPMEVITSVEVERDVESGSHSDNEPRSPSIEKANHGEDGAEKAEPKLDEGIEPSSPTQLVQSEPNVKESADAEQQLCEKKAAAFSCKDRRVKYEDLKKRFENVSSDDEADEAALDWLNLKPARRRGDNNNGNDSSLQPQIQRNEQKLSSTKYQSQPSNEAGVPEFDEKDIMIESVLVTKESPMIVESAEDLMEQPRGCCCIRIYFNRNAVCPRVTDSG